MLSTMSLCKLVCTLTFNLIILTGSSLASISCMDMNGRPVDWFIVYKLPIEESNIASVQNGSAFMYMDVNSQTFRQSDVSLDNEEQAIGFTLKQIYRDHRNQDTGYGMYNDEHPDGKTTARGHTKGVLALDSDTGFWLVHSVPRFPNLGNESYAWPDSARRNGQTFLCLTLAYQQFEEIGKQLMYSWPSTYDTKMSSSLASNIPSLVSALGGKHLRDAPYNRTGFLSTEDGQKFISFAKSHAFNADMYSAWVAPYFGSDLYTETWQDGRGKLPSCCNMTYKVMNVQMASINGLPIEETKDHSKWAITTNRSKQWTCIGDINRQEGQFGRGGGTVCTDLPNVWSAFNSAINKVETCPSSPSK